MIVKVLASGSKGNVTLIKTKKNNILIDAGLPFKNIEKRIEEFPNIDIIIITHTHDDHIKGLRSYIKKYNPCIITQSEDLLEKLDSEKITITNNYELDNLKIELLTLSHDVKCSGIIIKEEKELVYITDTGYINNKILDKIKSKDMYIIESNHDIEKLRNGRYPFYLQQRILGDRGHLSNIDCSRYIEKIISEKTKNIVLAHLSEENNEESLAYNTTYEKIKEKNIKLYIAKQDEALDWIEV